VIPTGRGRRSRQQQKEKRKQEQKIFLSHFDTLFIYG